MIRIKCAYCGERDHSEFSYGGDASINYPKPMIVHKEESARSKIMFKVV